MGYLVAAIEISVVARGCLSRRVPAMRTLIRRLAALEAARTVTQPRIYSRIYSRIY